MHALRVRPSAAWSIGVFVLLLVNSLSPIPSHAQSLDQAVRGSTATPVAIAVPVLASALSFGDIIDYDPDRGIYEPSQLSDDPFVFGVAAKDPPIVFQSQPGDVPVVRSGIALTNVTLENGPIHPGDRITASSIPGKGMRAGASSANPIGFSQEAFTGDATSTQTILLNGKPVAVGTIAVLIGPQAGLSGSANTDTSSGGQGLSSTAATCTPAITCVPFGLIMRYFSAAFVAFGSVYLAFRTFMAGAVSGVVSIGRNPRARATIQGMVVFNGILSAVVGIAGLCAALVILFFTIP